MNWADILIPLGSALISGLGGALIGKHLLGKPPAPRSEWDLLEKQAAADLRAKQAKKE